MKSTVVVVRIPDWLLKLIDEDAKTENRKRSNMINTILIDHYKKEKD